MAIPFSAPVYHDRSARATRPPPGPVTFNHLSLSSQLFYLGLLELLQTLQALAAEPAVPASPPSVTDNKIGNTKDFENSDGKDEDELDGSRQVAETTFSVEKVGEQVAPDLVSNSPRPVNLPDLVLDCPVPPPILPLPDIVPLHTQVRADKACETTETSRTIKSSKAKKRSNIVETRREKFGRSEEREVTERVVVQQSGREARCAREEWRNTGARLRRIADELGRQTGNRQPDRRQPGSRQAGDRQAGRRRERAAWWRQLAGEDNASNHLSHNAHCQRPHNPPGTRTNPGLLHLALQGALHIAHRII